MELTIEKLRLVLPSGYSDRAESIAREVIQQLAKRPFIGSYQVGQLTIPSISTYSGEVDGALASRIADAIHLQLNKTRSSQGLDTWHSTRLGTQER